ncbi:MAG: sulfotransferase family 2 domain-containing protein [Pelagimonas sp.]|uniref:sulfotransferase family 2 domain-containing protein n=1 Tax=Pelagimonas sp. TaxID=2073170 RepID=UPI003D6C1CA0
MLSKSRNFLFIHVPKTGGNSIQRVLLPFSDDRMVLTGPHHDGVERFEIRSPRLDIHKHSTLQDYQQQLTVDEFAKLSKVTCVRNPWDRCVSFFFSPHRGEVEWTPKRFETFIRETVQPHAYFLSLPGQSDDPFDNLDFVLRFEHLDDDFAALCAQLGIGDLDLPQINVSRRSDYRAYYTDQSLVDLVAEKFAPEIERFDYRFQHPEFGPTCAQTLSS